MKFNIGDRISYGGAMIGPEEKEAISRVIDSQGGRRWTIGPESVAFEQELASVTGVKRAVVVNSGSSALLLSLTAFHFPKGSKVIIPACNFPTAFNSIIQCNLTPIVVDSDIKTLNLDLEEVKKAILKYPEIAAVIAVNIAGNPVDLLKLREIVGKRKIILDNCDGYGTTMLGLIDGKTNMYFVERFADVSCVSFHAAHIITMGEGGAILTDDEQLGNTAVKLREWGRASGTDNICLYPGLPQDYKERYVYDEIGYNMKPLELQCAMGRVQLKKLQMFKEARKKNYDLLTNEFKVNNRFTLIESLPNSDVCWFSFPVMCNIPRGPVMKDFERNNIETRTIFSGNITRHPAYKDTNYIKIGTLEHADDIMNRGMFISCHPSLINEMIGFIGKIGRTV
jgi:CDP-6-deoxy-D-xylo-4-hexulose-3-dehydrase